MLEKSILIVGLGGTGSTAAEMFSRLGVKKLILVDRDKIELTNLHRQILYGMDDLKKYKAETAAEKLRNINPGVQVEFYNETFDSSMAWLVNSVDLVFDGTDNMTTRFIINDACDKYGKPMNNKKLVSFLVVITVVIMVGTSLYGGLQNTVLKTNSFKIYWRGQSKEIAGKIYPYSWPGRNRKHRRGNVFTARCEKVNSCGS